MEHVLPDERRVGTVLELLRLGYADRMVLSHDAAFFSRVTPPSWRAEHAPHWHMENLPRRIVPLLLAGGATEEDVQQMLVPTRPGCSRPGGAEVGHDDADLDRHRLPQRDARPRSCTHAPRPASTGSRSSSPTWWPRRPAPRRSAALAGRLGPHAGPLPAVPRRRGGRRGGCSRAVLHRARVEVPAHAAAGHRHHARVQQRRHRHRRRRRGVGRPAAPARGARPRRTASGWPTRRSPGAASSTTTAAPGGSSSWPTTRAVGVCLDSFHILSRGHDPAAIEQIPGEKIFFLQLADAPALTMDVLSWSRHHRLFPGEGSFDLASFVGHVLAPATPARCRSRSSTTRSGRPRCCAPPSRPSGR